MSKETVGKERGEPYTISEARLLVAGQTIDPYPREMMEFLLSRIDELESGRSIDQINVAFFNHDSDGGDGEEDEDYESRRKQWESFKRFLYKRDAQESRESGCKDKTPRIASLGGYACALTEDSYANLIKRYPELTVEDIRDALACAAYEEYEWFKDDKVPL